MGSPSATRDGTRTGAAGVVLFNLFETLFMEMQPVTHPGPPLNGASPDAVQ